MSALQADASLSRVQGWLARRSRWQRYGVATAAGAAATLGQAPFQLTLVYIAALAVLFWLLDLAAAGPRRVRAGFALGWFFGLGYFTCGLYWVASAFIERSAEFAPWGIPATVLLAAAIAFFFGFGGALATGFWKPDVRRVFVFATALFISEWLRGNIFTGFPWILPGYVWTPGEPISQLASVVGIYGLSLLTLLAAGALAMIAEGRAQPAARFAPTVIAALSIGLAWGWGMQRIAHAPVDPPGALPVVRVAESGLTQRGKWCEYGTMDERIACARGQEWRVLQLYLDASGPPEQSHADILVWPEGAVPTLNFFQLDNQPFLDELGRGLGDRALIVGLTRCAPHARCDAFMRGQASADSLQLFNSAAVIDGVGGVPRLSQTYDKHHLVPFGEYIPFWQWVRQFNIAPLQEIGAGFFEGPPPTRLVVPGAPPASVLICYEAIFPGLTPRGDERPGWIVNISNDAWFGDLRWFTGPYQHFAMSKYRAIEEGLPMARAASGGISAIVDAYGRTVRSTQNRSLFVEAQLPPALAETSFARLGNILLVVLLSFTGVLGIAPVLGATRGRV